MDGVATKKIKQTLPPEVYTFPNFSDILAQPYIFEDNKNTGFIYRISSSPDFGVILPFQPLPFPNHLLEPLGLFRFSLQSLADIRNFQHEFWTDLIRAPKPKEGNLSNANYLIVPLTNNEINWTVMYLLLGKDKPLKVCEILPKN